ncbi:MAG: non-homologous end-joining DNA ligase, partial [Myxococcota bacterium]
MGIGAYAVEISNPDRIVFPDAGFSKADVVAYYERAAPLMMPHLMGRPLTLQRFPRGIGAKGFMQKNAAKHFPSFIERVPVVHQERETIYPVVHDAMGLRYLANQGTVTFHIWTTRARALDRPDHIVFDLDPPRGDPAAARTAARDVRTLLQELGLASAVCATGSQGYHVLFPVRPELDLVAIGLFCRRVAELLARRHPERLTTEFRKKNRRGRVFIDWLRNR